MQAIEAYNLFPEYFNNEKSKKGVILDVCEKMGISKRTAQRMKKIINYMQEKKIKVNPENITLTVEEMKLAGKSPWR